MTGARWNLFLFVVLPYLAAATFVFASLRRYLREPWTFTSRSSQFLENERQFWGAVPFHHGLLGVLLIHLAAVSAPDALLRWNGVPWRLYLLEATGFALGLLALVGLLVLVVRRLSSPALRVVTTGKDWVVAGLLLMQVALGAGVAATLPWGYSWFASSLAPYLRSLAALDPEPAYVTSLPWSVKAHVLGFFLLLLAFPFSRLVHALVPPLPYLWRRPQVVRWTGPRRTS